MPLPTPSARAPFLALAVTAGLCLTVLPGSTGDAEAHPHYGRQTITCPVGDERAECVQARKDMREAREELRRTAAEFRSGKIPGFDPEELKRDLRATMRNLEEMEFTMLSEKEQARIRADIRRAIQEADFDSELIRRDIAEGAREVEKALSDLEAKENETITITVDD